MVSYHLTCDLASSDRVTSLTILPFLPITFAIDFQAVSNIIEVPFVANASAFAISLEDTGGSIQPTTDQIYALGTV